MLKLITDSIYYLLAVKDKSKLRWHDQLRYFLYHNPYREYYKVKYAYGEIPTAEEI